MSNLKDLLNQSSHYLVGRGLAVLIGLVSFPVYARLLSVGDYGILNLAQRLSLVGVAIAKFGLQNAILRFYETSFESEGSLRRLFSTTFFGTVLGALVCATLCTLFFISPYAAWISPNVRRALLVTCGLVFIRATASPLYGFLRVEGRTFAFNGFDVLTRLLSLVIGVTLLLHLNRKPQTLLLGLILAESLAIATVLVSCIPLSRLKLAYFDRKLLRTALVFSAPLAGAELAQVLLGSADRALVLYYLGSEFLGHYAAACSIAIILQEALQMPLNLALVPMYVKIWHNEGPEATGRFVGLAFEVFLLAACAISAVAFASAGELITLASSAKYFLAGPLLGPLVAGYMFMAASVFFSAGFFVQKQTMKMPPLMITAFLIKSALNIILLPRIGLAGAVIPNIVGSVLVAGLYAAFSHRLLRLQISYSRCLSYVGAAVAAGYWGHGIQRGSTIESLAASALTTLAIYAVLVLLLDPRARLWLRQLPALRGG